MKEKPHKKAGDFKQADISSDRRLGDSGDAGDIGLIESISRLEKIAISFWVAGMSGKDGLTRVFYIISFRTSLGGMAMTWMVVSPSGRFTTTSTGDSLGALL